MALSTCTVPLRTIAIALIAALALGCAATTDETGEDSITPAAPAPPAPKRGMAGTPPSVAALDPDGGLTETRAPGADAAARADVSRAATDAAPFVSVDAGFPDAMTTTSAASLVPVIWLEVAGKTIGKDIDTPGRIKIFEDADATATDLAVRVPTLESAMVIEVHGNSSAGFPKKSYNIELRDAMNLSNGQKVLGMPSESDWVLYACYSDKTCLRNALVYSVGRELGRYNPRTRFAEVFLDKKHIGLYLVVEKVKRDNDRVPIDAPAKDAASGDLSGGYIINRQGAAKPANGYWISKLGTLYQYRSPSAKQISPQQKSYIQGHVDKVEAVFAAPNWMDPEQGYRKWIEFPSWVDFALMQEFTKNADGYRRSGFLTKQSDAKGGLLTAGPLWDFDIALGNVDYIDGWKPEGWGYKVNPLIVALKVPKEELIQFYWEKIWTDPVFQNAARCRWNQLRLGPLEQKNLNAKIDAWVALLSKSETRDHAIWKVVGTKIWPNYYVGMTYADEVKYLRDWIGKRLAWVDANLPGVCAE